jgi:hypothetical protein
MKDKRFFNRFKLNSGINSTIFLTNMFGTSKSKDKLSFFSYFGIIMYKKFVPFQTMDKLVLLKHFYLFLHFTWKLIMKNDWGGRFRIVYPEEGWRVVSEERERLRSGSKDKKIDFLDTNNELI